MFAAKRGEIAVDLAEHVPGLRIYEAAAPTRGTCRRFVALALVVSGIIGDPGPYV